MFRNRFALATQLARWVVPSIVFLLAVGSAFFVAGSLYGSMFKLITDLSSWGPSQPLPVTPGQHIRFSGIVSIAVAGVTLLIVAHVLATMAGDAVASRRLLRFTGMSLLVIAMLGACLAISRALPSWAARWRSSYGSDRRCKSAQLKSAKCSSYWESPSSAECRSKALRRAFADEQAGGFSARAECWPADWPGVFRCAT